MMELFKRVDFWLCAASFAAVVILTVIFVCKTVSLKKTLPEEKKTKPSASYIGSVVTGFVLPVLPVLIELDFYVVLIICACAVLGSYMALKDRYVNLSKKDEE